MCTIATPGYLTVTMSVCLSVCQLPRQSTHLLENQTYDSIQYLRKVFILYCQYNRYYKKKKNNLLPKQSSLISEQASLSQASMSSGCQEQKDQFLATSFSQPG